MLDPLLPGASRPLLACAMAALWGLAALLAAAFLVMAVPQYLVFTPESYGRYWDHRAGLFLHVCGGALTLAAGLVQFLAPIRRTRPQVHRWLGRVYLTGVAVGAPTALYLAANPAAGWMAGVLLFTLGSLWIVTSGMALVAIRRGQVAAHREWMVRSYVLTFSFVLVRVLLATPLFSHAALPERLATLGWLSWTVPLFVAELCMQWKRSVHRPGRRVGALA
jgi:uncharacterized membrane protein